MKEGFKGERSLVLPRMAIEMEEADPLTASLHITDIGYYPMAEGHFVRREKSIKEHVLIYCVKGCGSYQVEGQHYHLHPNEYCILPAQKPHQYEADVQDPWTIYWIHFKGPHADIYAQGAVQPCLINPSINSRISERNNIFEEIYFTLADGYSRENLRYASSLLHHYLASMRYLNQYRGAQQGKKDAAADSGIGSAGPTYMIAAAVHYMKENMEKTITLAQLANYTGYSASHFSMLFKQHTGHSPLAYLNILRIQKACHWLTQSELKINQICHMIGFDDQYYFSRLFASQMGMSPRTFRNQVQNYRRELASKEKSD